MKLSFDGLDVYTLNFEAFVTFLMSALIHHFKLCLKRRDKEKLNMKKIFKKPELNAIQRVPKKSLSPLRYIMFKSLNFGTLKLVLWSKVRN